jgi:hypothetical protein
VLTARWNMRFAKPSIPILFYCGNAAKLSQFCSQSAARIYNLLIFKEFI